MKFSIIIPLYNKEKYIRRVLDSILNQDYKDFEIIVVNDGSTDNSRLVVNKIVDDRIKIVNKENGGVSSARNRGIDEAHGEWVLFLDADDILLPGALRSFYDATIKFKAVKVIVSNFQNIDLDGNISLHSKLTRDKLYINPMKGIWFKEFTSRPGNTIYHCSIFSLTGEYNENISYNEDNEFSERVLAQFNVVYIPTVTMQYIKTRGSASLQRHDLKKDYAYYLKYRSINSKWQRLRYGSLIYFASQRLKGAEEYDEFYKCNKDYFKKTFQTWYFFNLVYRRLRNLILVR